AACFPQYALRRISRAEFLCCRADNSLEQDGCAANLRKAGRLKDVLFDPHRLTYQKMHDVLACPSGRPRAAEGLEDLAGFRREIAAELALKSLDSLADRP